MAFWSVIEDEALRAKFEADIDQMTAIIESALTYTRAELNVEAPRELSLSALVDNNNQPLISDAPAESAAGQGPNERPPKK